MVTITVALTHEVNCLVCGLLGATVCSSLDIKFNSLKSTELSRISINSPGFIHSFQLRFGNSGEFVSEATSKSLLGHAGPHLYTQAKYMGGNVARLCVYVSQCLDNTRNINGRLPRQTLENPSQIYENTHEFAANNTQNNFQCKPMAQKITN